MKKRFWIVRHGQTDWNVAGRYQGHADIPLNDTGRQQAEAAASKLRHAPLTAIHSSDLSRARETAEIIAREVRLPVRIDARLREVNQGHCEGLHRAEVLEKYPELMRTLADHPLCARMPGGESVMDTATRIDCALSEIFAQENLPLIVSHGLVLGIVRCLAGGRPLDRARSHVPENACPEEVVWHYARLSQPTAGALAPRG